MPFEIRTLKGVAINMYTLNREVRDVWNVEPVYKNQVEIFAYPPNDPKNDWVEVIGFAIEKPMLFREHVMQQDWNDVKQTLFNIQMDQLSDEINLSDRTSVLNKVNGALNFLQPYYHLIDVWDSKGYLPVRIK